MFIMDMCIVFMVYKWTWYTELYNYISACYIKCVAGT